jgi:mannose-6-phosphate isomerase
MTEALHQPLIVTPEYRDYVWGGQRLRPGQLTAEAWIVYEGDKVTSGPLKDHTLADLAAEYGSALLGTRPIKRTGTRFPVLIKLLDCAEWLSLQVHPNDEQAKQLAGPDHFGKTEAWHILDATPTAEILGGLREGTTKELLEKAVRGGTLVNQMERINVHTGDTVFIRAGTIHALGPGLLLYEIQQTSDLTYRVFDWNRPASEGRKLHIEESLAVAAPNATAPVTPRPPFVDGQATTLIKCDYFTLDLLTAHTKSIELATHGESFHALTIIEGEAVVENGNWHVPLKRLETAIIPAVCEAYRVKPQGRMQMLKASAA